MDNQSESKGDSAFSVGKDFFKPVSVNSMLRNEANQVSDEAVKKIAEFGKATMRVFDKATAAADKFMAENPKAVPGALMVAGALVLPSMVVAAIPEVVDMYHRGVVANPVGLKEWATAAGILASNTFVLNEGIKATTGESLFGGEAKKIVFK